MAHTLWHTIRLANSHWPFAFGDVQAQTDEHGPDIGAVNAMACATNQGGNLHVLAMDGNGKLWHTIRLAADGTWSAFGDVQAQTDQHGPNIGQIHSPACATNQGGDLHVLVLDSNDTLWHTIRLGADGTWPFPFRDVQAQTDQHGPGIGPVIFVACATSQGGDLHVLATDQNNKLWHTIRLAADGTWSTFGDVQAQTDQHGPNIGNIGDPACATNEGGDLHVLALDSNNKLWHTIRLANGHWPFAFGDVQAQTDQHGPNIGKIGDPACATNEGGDLHVLALDSNNKLWHTIRLAADDTWSAFGDVQAQTDQHGPAVVGIDGVACATNQAGDLHVCAENGITLE
jgi:hypothetical protein